jgi:hypothetical protein
MADGGNCEIGLIGRIPDSLAPKSVTILSREQLAAIRLRRREERAAAVVVLAAELMREGLKAAAG